MQSVGAPNAHQIDLVLSPASVVLQAGAQYIVNTLRNVTVVSMSFGLCESDEVQSGGAITDRRAMPICFSIRFAKDWPKGKLVLRFGRLGRRWVQRPE